MWLAVLAVVVASSGSCTSPAAPRSAGSTPPTASPAGSQSSSASPPPANTPTASPSSSSTHSDRVTIAAPADGSLLVHGTYPNEPSPCVQPKERVLDARYPGRLTASRAGDGTITLTVTLPFEQYLEGIAEVPSSWPSAALRAQAIAARSYALATTGWRGRSGERLTSPICASTSCQVFRGLPVTEASGTGIERWYQAVADTAGLVLLHGGRPAQTLYSSTSNGRTYGNDEVFGSSPLPYLRPVPERDDLASPTSHWTATLPLADLTLFLRAAGEWPAGAGIRRAVRHGSAVTVGGGGVTRTLALASFRSAINLWAPCLRPERYPPISWKGTPLPVTLPSLWFRVAPRTGAVALIGRGYGHGVGMMQWGAYGKALRGFTAGRILAYYYGGLRPLRFPEPSVIRVEVGHGLSSVSVEPSGTGATLAGRPLAGPVRITGGTSLSITS